MQRVALTDNSGKWFDIDTAESFEEATRWDGNNNISRVTGSQWQHQKLYRTTSGTWVLHEYSQVQGELEQYTKIVDSEAAAWFTKNEYADEDIPEDLRELLAEEIKNLEI